jgi:transcription elongation factor Elf1
MADYVDTRYVNLLAGRFARFSIKHRNPLKVNFRCPICNDSQKSQTKARGWLTENTKTQTLFYSCFNCGVSHSFQNFLKLQDPTLYKEYVAEKFLNKEREPNRLEIPNPEKPVFDKSPLKSIKKISQLKHDHPVKAYIDSRQIPSDQHYRLYYAPKFRTWINSIIPDKFPSVTKDEPRLILPFFDENGKCFGVSARGFDPNGLRYITIMFREVPKIFGIDRVDFEKPTIITEGPIDSLFLSNSIAMVGADLNFQSLQNVNKKENIIFCFDNEPRNSEIVKRMERVIKNGYKVCIWPHNVPGKDINEMWLNGKRDIEKTIKENTFSGLEGQLRLAAWRKT